MRLSHLEKYASAELAAKTDFRAELTPPGATESLHLDLTGNFWGTHGQMVHDGKVLAQARMSKKGYKVRLPPRQSLECALKSSTAYSLHPGSTPSCALA